MKLLPSRRVLCIADVLYSWQSSPGWKKTIGNNYRAKKQKTKNKNKNYSTGAEQHRTRIRPHQDERRPEILQQSLSLKETYAWQSSPGWKKTRDITANRSLKKIHSRPGSRFAPKSTARDFPKATPGRNKTTDLSASSVSEGNVLYIWPSSPGLPI